MERLLVVSHGENLQLLLCTTSRLMSSRTTQANQDEDYRQVPQVTFQFDLKKNRNLGVSNGNLRHLMQIEPMYSLGGDTYR